MHLQLIQTRTSVFADEVVVNHFPFVLGRSSCCDHQVVHPMVSRRHAELKVGDKGVTLLDLSSSNGTYLNGTRIENGAVLCDGDEIYLGCVSYRVTLAPSNN